jgi:hypothetical protein
MKIAPNPIKLVKSFSDVKSDLSRMDGNLTQWENDGRTYPGSTVDDTFRSMARDLDNATLGFSDLHPDRKALLENFKKDTLDLAFHAGMTGSMNQQSSVFGSGWRNVMDPSIAHAGEAINVLTEVAGGEGREDAAPTPLKLMRDLSDVQSELTRWDANFTQWQADGRTYPGSNVSTGILKLAGKMYDARNDLRELYPEQVDLIKNMQSDIMKVAGNAGSTKHMYSQSVSFGSGWSESFDRSIQDVRQAINLIVDSAGNEGSGETSNPV